jgi:hypothetical protein
VLGNRFPVCAAIHPDAILLHDCFYLDIPILGSVWRTGKRSSQFGPQFEPAKLAQARRDPDQSCLLISTYLSSDLLQLSLSRNRLDALLNGILTVFAILPWRPGTTQQALSIALFCWRLSRAIG